MPRRILIIQGHPDPSEGHLGHALAAAYAKGARRAGHEVRTLAVGELAFPLLRSQRDWHEGAVPPAIREAQESVGWADHLVILYPLWLGTMPALLKGFMEQLFRPGFAFSQTQPGTMGRHLLTGKSARVVVTMGMPGLVYRWFYRAHSLKNLERNILHFVGIKPVKATLFGLVEGVGEAKRQKWLANMERLGEAAR